MDLKESMMFLNHIVRIISFIFLVNWYQDWICDEGEDCTIPNHYKYEFDTGSFDCVDLDICGVDITWPTCQMEYILLEIQIL